MDPTTYVRMGSTYIHLEAVLQGLEQYFDTVHPDRLSHDTRDRLKRMSHTVDSALPHLEGQE